jgi:hypothetical protein
MELTLHFDCSGCDAKETVKSEVTKVFRSFSGRSHGLGTHYLQWPENVDALAPEGWVAFDPYTLVTYCPECWAEIEVPTDAALETESNTPWEDSPVAWFCLLERARLSSNFDLAARAQSELTALGVEVRYLERGE